MIRELRIAFRVARREGGREFTRRSLAYYNPLKHPAVAPRARRVFGRRVHQKLLVAPHLGYWPRIRNPQTFNEKVLHRMLFADNSVFDTLNDKVLVRDFGAERVGREILPRVYHITDDPATIPFADLPEAYVVKSSFGTGNVVLVDDRRDVDTDAIRTHCKGWLERDYHLTKVVRQGNHHYNTFDPRVLVEDRLEDGEHDPPLDYKFYVFDGRVEYVHVDVDRFGDAARRFYDRDWTPQGFRKGGKPLAPAIDEPDRLDEMIDIAESLGEGFGFMRVDLYNLDERIVFGELTSAPANGMSPFEPRNVDFEFGALWNEGTDRITSPPPARPSLQLRS